MKTFATQITATDPNHPEEGTKVWSGPSIEAHSIENARELAEECYGYLEVIGEDDNARVIHREPLLSQSDEPETYVEEVELEVGDVVCLSSGGPSMTIVDIISDTSEVAFFIGHELFRPQFPTASLMLMHR